MTPVRRRPHDLSPGDAALWESVMRGAAPLRGRRRAQSSSPPTPAVKGAPPPPAAPPSGPPLAHGRAAGLDRRLFDRLRRGRLAIDAKVDLHGLTQAEAHRRLEEFLADSQAQGLRCVLVVTGKGLGKAEAGLLRANAPRWLNEPSLRPRVLGFDYAQPRHGGAGALYVLLRRRR